MLNTKNNENNSGEFKDVSRERINEKLNALKDELVGDAEDASKMESNLDRLLSLQKQLDVEPVELIVPCSEVTATLDFGSYVIKKTAHGFLFSTRGGLSVFVSYNVRSVADMLQAVFDMQESGEVSDYDKDLYVSAVAYAMQAPLFASMRPESLYAISAAILGEFNDYSSNIVEHEETEADVKENIAFNDATEAIERISEEVKNLKPDA